MGHKFVSFCILELTCVYVYVCVYVCVCWPWIVISLFSLCCLFVCFLCVLTVAFICLFVCLLQLACALTMELICLFVCWPRNSICFVFGVFFGFFFVLVVCVFALEFTLFCLFFGSFVWNACDCVRKYKVYYRNSSMVRNMCELFVNIDHLSVSLMWPLIIYARLFEREGSRPPVNYQLI